MRTVSLQIVRLHTGEQSKRNREHLRHFVRVHTSVEQLLDHRHLLCFVLFTRHKLFSDEVALRSHPSAVGITPLFRHVAASFSDHTVADMTYSTPITET